MVRSAPPVAPRPRRLERSGVWALVPLAAMVPFTLLALAVFWLPLRLATGVSYWWIVVAFVGIGPLVFVRPFQIWALTRLLRARPPTPDEAATIEPLWNEIAAANALPPEYYVVRVIDSDQLNAFACGGHLVVVTTFAVTELTTAELQGVLAHELSHHLGLHTLSITIGHWLSSPVVVLARVGFFMENVATAAVHSFGRRSPLVDALGTVAAVFIRAASWIFTFALRAEDLLTNLVGHQAEYEADQRAVRMGFGHELAGALRRVLADSGSQRPIGWRARLAASHPPARTRVARIETLLRHPTR